MEACQYLQVTQSRECCDGLQKGGDTLEEQQLQRGPRPLEIL